MTQAEATRVFITRKVPKREPVDRDRAFLCYEPSCPPWDKEIFFVQDEANRTWYCHEADMELNDAAIQHFADRLKQEYSPQNPAALARRVHNPLNIEVVVCQAADLDELRSLLGKVKLQYPAGWSPEKML